MQKTANYRKAGYDFISVTDHGVYHASAETEKKLDFLKNYTLIVGEEVHNCICPSFHMVNLGGSYSISDIFIDDKERVKREVEELAKEVEVPQNLDPKEYLTRVWMYREIKKSGGFAILSHIYWYIGYHNVQTKMSRAVIKNGLCDALELMSGVTPDKDCLTLAFYNDLRAEGINVPIVGVSDGHSVMNEEKSLFKRHYTIAYAEENDIIKAVKNTVLR